MLPAYDFFIKKLYNGVMKRWFHIRLDQYKDELENEMDENEG